MVQLLSRIPKRTELAAHLFHVTFLPKNIASSFARIKGDLPQFLLECDLSDFRPHTYSSRKSQETKTSIHM